MSVIGQIVNNLKNSLVSKEIQKIPSIRLYCKVISIGKNTVSFSSLVSLSKTLGPELETLSILNVNERINYLQKTYNNLLKYKGAGKVFSSPNLLYNADNLTKHRKGLAIQCRSILVATPIFSSHSIVQNTSISNITLNCVLESAKIFWTSIGLDEKEFDFLLRKEAKVSYNLYGDYLPFSNLSNNLLECVKLIIYIELKQTLNIKNKLFFTEDDIILNNKDNLCSLERELGFIERLFPNLLSTDISLSDYDLKDDLIRISLDQLRRNKNSFEDIFNNKKNTSNKRFFY